MQVNLSHFCPTSVFLSLTGYTQSARAAVQAAHFGRSPEHLIFLLWHCLHLGTCEHTDSALVTWTYAMLRFTAGFGIESSLMLQKGL